MFYSNDDDDGDDIDGSDDGDDIMMMMMIWWYWWCMMLKYVLSHLLESRWQPSPHYLHYPQHILWSSRTPRPCPSLMALGLGMEARTDGGVVVVVVVVVEVVVVVVVVVVAEVVVSMMAKSPLSKLSSLTLS